MYGFPIRVFKNWCEELSIHPTGINKNMKEVGNTDSQRAPETRSSRWTSIGLTATPEEGTGGRVCRDEPMGSASNRVSQGGPSPGPREGWMTHAATRWQPPPPTPACVKMCVHRSILQTISYSLSSHLLFLSIVPSVRSSSVCYSIHLSIGFLLHFISLQSSLILSIHPSIVFICKKNKTTTFTCSFHITVMQYYYVGQLVSYQLKPH